MTPTISLVQRTERKTDYSKRFIGVNFCLESRTIGDYKIV